MDMLTIIYDTVASMDVAGNEYIVIPVYENDKIYVYRLPSGDAGKVKGLLFLPVDAELLDIYPMADCENTLQVYEECERLAIQATCGILIKEATRPLDN